MLRDCLWGKETPPETHTHSQRWIVVRVAPHTIKDVKKFVFIGHCHSSTPAKRKKKLKTHA